LPYCRGIQLQFDVSSHPCACSIFLRSWSAFGARLKRSTATLQGSPASFVVWGEIPLAAFSMGSVLVVISRVLDARLEHPPCRVYDFWVLRFCSLLLGSQS